MQDPFSGSHENIIIRFAENEMVKNDYLFNNTDYRGWDAAAEQGEADFSSRLRTVGLSAEFGRGESGIAFEGAAETENIGIAAFDRHLADRQIGMLDQFAGMVAAEPMEKLSERNAVELTPDLQAEMRFGKIHHFSQILDARGMVVIIPDMLHHLIHERIARGNRPGVGF